MFYELFGATELRAMFVWAACSARARLESYPSQPVTFNLLRQ